MLDKPVAPSAANDDIGEETRLKLFETQVVIREADQERRARTSPDKQEVAQAARRADKARYLRQKLDERADSEREKND